MPPASVTPAPVESPKQPKPVAVAKRPKLGAPKKKSDNKRKIKTRCPFDIYEDQAVALKKLALEEKLEGGSGSMSAMVRDALDAYLKKQN